MRNKYKTGNLIWPSVIKAMLFVAGFAVMTLAVPAHADYSVGSKASYTGTIDEALYADMLAGKVTELGTGGRIDLDGDGDLEKVSLTAYGDIIENWQGNRYASFCELIVDGYSYILEGDGIEDELYGVSLDGRTINLFLYDIGPSDDPSLTFLNYKDRTLQECGTIETYPETLFVNGNKINAIERCRVIETGSIYTLWEYLENDTLREVDLDVYEFAYPLGNEWHAYLKTDLDVMDGEDHVTTIHPQKVMFAYTDRESRVYVVGEDGSCGWMNTEDYGYSGSTDLFDGLVMAD